MWCWVMANARQSPQICFPLRRRTGLKPYYKIHLRNVLGKLREKILINSISWWLAWIRAGCNCHLGHVLLVVFIVLILLQFLEESYLWTGGEVADLASVADTVPCCEPRWQPAKATGYDGRWFAAILPALDVRIYFALLTMPDVNADKVLYKPILMESGWCSRGWILVWYDYHIWLVIHVWNFKKKISGKFYGLLKMNRI